MALSSVSVLEDSAIRRPGIFGRTGLCRRYFSTESQILRHVSDSLFWLYLTHLVLVILNQWLLRNHPRPAPITFTAITMLISDFLLLPHDDGVRYSAIGYLLNGPRSRTALQLLQPVVGQEVADVHEKGRW